VKKSKTKPAADKDQKSTKITLTKTLLCKLSEKELARAGKDLADNMDKIEAIEQQKKTADDGFKKDIETNTQRINQTLESVIRRFPDQWFWVHRRWERKEKIHPK